MTAKLKCKDLLNKEASKFLFSQQFNNIDKAIEVAEKEKPHLLSSLKQFKVINLDYYQEAKEVFIAFMSMSGE